MYMLVKKLHHHKVKCLVYQTKISNTFLQRIARIASKTGAPKRGWGRDKKR